MRARSSDRTDDHIAILTQRIVHLEPDLIVIFSGINDLRASLAGLDYLHRPHSLGGRTAKPWRWAATELQIGRLGYYLLRGEKPEPAIQLDGSIMTHYRQKVEQCQSLPLSSIDVLPDADAYERNLNTLAGVAHGHGTDILFMTQQTTWNSAVDESISAWHWLQAVNGVRYAPEQLDAEMRSMNVMMRKVANEHNCPVYDVEQMVPKSSEFFYDDVHFNRKGAAVAGQRLGDLIASTYFSD